MYICELQCAKRAFMSIMTHRSQLKKLHHVALQMYHRLLYKVYTCYVTNSSSQSHNAVLDHYFMQTLCTLHILQGCLQVLKKHYVNQNAWLLFLCREPGRELVRFT